MTDTTPQPEQAPETIAAPQATAEQLAYEREDAVLMQLDGEDPDDEQPAPQATASEEAAPEAAPAAKTE